jgi:hypothetical protein
MTPELAPSLADTVPVDRLELVARVVPGSLHTFPDRSGVVVTAASAFCRN